jgi:hypothetical protein
MKGLILSYSSSLGWDRIESFLSTHEEIPYWYAPFLGCVILTTTLTARQIRERIDEYFGKSSTLFLIVGPNPEEVEGRLPKPAWDALLRPERARELRDEPYVLALDQDEQRERFVTEAQEFVSGLLSSGFSEATSEGRIELAIAEDLALRFVEQQIKLPIRRHVGFYRGDERWMFDGVVQTAAGYVAIEVKFVQNLNVAGHAERLKAALLSSINGLQKWQGDSPATLIFVAVVSGSPDETKLRITLEGLANNAPVLTRIFVLSFDRLKAQYGLTTPIVG